MGYEPSARVAALLPRFRALADRLAPIEAELLASGGHFRSLLPALNAVRAEVKADGLWAPHLPEAWGGLGLSIAELAPVSEALGRSPLGHYVVQMQAPDAGNAELLLHAGTPDQLRTLLGPLARGEVRSAFGMTEPEHAGSNPTMMSTVARRDGGDWVLDGHKWFTTGMEGSAFVIVVAVTDPDGPAHQRATLFVVPSDAPGLTLVRNLPVMGESGEDWMSHAEIRLDGVRVPDSARLGGVGEGFALAQTRLGPGRIHHCMRWVGIAERAFDLMCRRATTRMIAPGTPLGARQLVQAQIGECRVAIDAARLMVLDAAEAIDREGTRASRVKISAIKLFTARMLHQVLDTALQIHGGLGMTDDLLLAFWYRHERAARIYDGADEVHLSLIAREVLKAHGLRA